MFWKKKEIPKEPEYITFNAVDDNRIRARKMWRYLGFVNDRFGNCALIHEILDIYDKLDAEYGITREG